MGNRMFASEERVSLFVLWGKKKKIMFPPYIGWAGLLVSRERWDFVILDSSAVTQIH